MGDWYPRHRWLLEVQVGEDVEADEPLIQLSSIFSLSVSLNTPPMVMTTPVVLETLPERYKGVKGWCEMCPAVSELGCGSQGVGPRKRVRVKTKRSANGQLKNHVAQSERRKGAYVSTVASCGGAHHRSFGPPKATRSP